MIEKPRIVVTNACKAAVVHLKIPRAKVEKEIDDAIKEILSVISSQGISPSGALFSHHLTQSSEVFDVEVGFPIEKSISRSGRVKTGGLPKTVAAFTVYRGDYDGLFDAWREFGEKSRPLLESERYEHGATLWEAYVVGPESQSDPINWKTELYQTLVKVR